MKLIKKAIFTIGVLFLFSAPAKSQSSIDTCLTVSALDSIAFSIQTIIDRNDLLEKMIYSCTSQSRSLLEQNESLAKIVTNYKLIDSKADQTIKNLNDVLNKTERKLKREKGLRWLWAGTGAGVVVGILALVK